MLESKLGKKVIRLSSYKDTMLVPLKKEQFKSVEVIFDNEMLTFGEIIAIMQRHCNDGYTYKIKPQGCNYILGSNDSNSRGNVLQW